MAIYRYQCTDCNNNFDLQITLQEKEEGKGEKFTCSKCHSKNIHQKFSLIHFIKNIFKGEESAKGSCNSKSGGGCC